MKVNIIDIPELTFRYCTANPLETYNDLNNFFCSEFIINSNSDMTNLVLTNNDQDRIVNIIDKSKSYNENSIIGYRTEGGSFLYSIFSPLALNLAYSELDKGIINLPKFNLLLEAYLDIKVNRPT